MIFNGCKFNPLEDIQEVDQFGFIDLVKAFQQGYVPGGSELVQESFNGIDEPESILGKPSDAFEAMRMQDMIVQNAKDRSASARKSSSKDEV